MSKKEVKNAIKQFLINETGFEDPEILSFNTNLFESGIVDSIMLVSLVSFCEDTFGLSLDVAELSEEDFKSIESIANLITNTLQN